MALRDWFGSFAATPPAGYTDNDRPIFAALDEKRCGDASVPRGGWSCLLRAGHTGGCWYSNPDWPPHYRTAAERDAAMQFTERSEVQK